ncbi:heavy-metal-associated domain-containing protein [Nereida ignava]|jgi:copper chaperone|uniref:heavy-metal-associated domain-containing protein n=1 Tax=Nereida ignava TaxID=282199 RepID=UPI003F6CCA1B
MQFSVPKMSCGHCTSTIEKAVKKADASATITCDLSERTVTIQGNIPADELSIVINGAGYENTLVAA